MSILASILNALVYPSYLLIHYYILIVFIAVVISWLEALNILNTSNHIVYLIIDTVRRLTEPFFKIFRKLLPPIGMVDLSPLLAIVALYFLERAVPAIILNLADMFAR